MRMIHLQLSVWDALGRSTFSCQFGVERIDQSGQGSMLKAYIGGGCESEFLSLLCSLAYKVWIVSMVNAFRVSLVH